MTYRRHTFHSDFYWNSKLSNDRKNEIIEWVKELSDDKAALLEDLIEDLIEDTRFGEYVS